MDSFARSVSHGLKYGVPLKSYVKTLMSTSFAPSGVTDDPEIKIATSITDYIFRRLALDYLSFDDRLELGLASFDDMPIEQATLPVDVLDTVSISSNMEKLVVEESTRVQQGSSTAKVVDIAAPLCYNCGNQTQRAGSCYVCSSCGSTTGCS